MKKIKNHSLPNEENIIGLLQNHGRPMRVEAMLADSNCPGNSARKFEKLLRTMANKGILQRLPGGFWGLKQASVYVTGEFTGFANGGGRVHVTEPPDYPQKEIFISPFQKDGAWHKDTVRVLALPSSGGMKGKIIAVLKRVQKRIPALLETRNKKTLRFRPADGRLTASFLVSAKSPLADVIAPGDLAILEPGKELPDNQWQATIRRVLGRADCVSSQEAIVKLGQQVPQAFPDLAVAQAEALPAAPRVGDFNDREDWRSLPFVTIDGADARDFDDAIHVEKTATGWILRVAIADVSHYVRPDCAPGSLDSEALARGNSWYFPRSVEPMLPKVLCNGLCSLKPGEDRLAILAELPFDANAKPLQPRFAAIAMRSRARLIYDDVAKFLAGEKINLPDPDLAQMLKGAHELYKKLAERRRECGTLDFYLPEPVYEFDNDGALVKIGDAQRNDAHMLIEEFMIAANEAVATYLGSQGQDFLYRVHPQPEREKLIRLYETLELTALESLPTDLRKDGEPNPAAIQQILANAAGTPQEYVVNRLCLRSMAQARYQPENIGHFGLASKAYCHFTSPIRRYADLLTHRALKATLGDKEHKLPGKEELTEIGDNLNVLERRAVECERDMAKRLACLFLQGKEGEIFSGTISGVADFGLFVEFVDIPADGLIRMEELGNDWFRLDQPRQALIGMRGGQVWRLGQPVKVKILSIDLERQEIRLAPAEKTKLKLTKTRTKAAFRGKERRSEHRKPARSSKWIKQPTPNKVGRKK